jgi:hypothetical protein
VVFVGNLLGKVTYILGLNQKKDKLGATLPAEGCHRGESIYYPKTVSFHFYSAPSDHVQAVRMFLWWWTRQKSGE